jgi:hypothetical protein
MIATLEKVRRALPNNIDAKLSKALAEARTLRERYNAIKSQLARKTDLSYFEAKTKSASAAYVKSSAPEDLERLVLAEMISAKAQERLAGLARAFHYGDAVRQQFQAENPSWKQKLLAVYQLKLEKAKAELETITAAETERLIGYETGEIENSPPVRRGAASVRRLEHALKLNDEITWSNFVFGIDADDE